MAWPPFSGGPRSVDTQVLTSRRKLEQAGLGEGGGIETMRQQGYRFSLDTLPEAAEESVGGGHRHLACAEQRVQQGLKQAPGPERSTNLRPLRAASPQRQ